MMASSVKNRGISKTLMLLLTFLLSVLSVLAQETPVTISKIGSSGDGTIVYGEYRCEPGCQEFTIPYAQYTGNVLKALPDDASRFVRWRTPDNHVLEGEFQVQPGDTILALFQDKRELFADAPGLGVLEPRHAHEVRGRYLHLFPEVLFEEEIVIFNLFDDVSLTFVREELEKPENFHVWDGEKFVKDTENYVWSGSIADEGQYGSATIVFDDGGGMTGSIETLHGQYSFGGSNGVWAVFEIDQSKLPSEDAHMDFSTQRRSQAFPRSSFAQFLGRCPSPLVILSS